MGRKLGGMWGAVVCAMCAPAFGLAQEVLEECPREHLREVYLQAVDRHETVDLAAVEMEVLKLCQERQGLISEIVRGEQDLEDLLAEHASERDAGRGRGALGGDPPDLGARRGRRAALAAHRPRKRRAGRAKRRLGAMKLVTSPRIPPEVRDVCAVFTDGTVWLAEGYDMDVDVLAKLALLRAGGLVPPERVREVRPLSDIAKVWREARASVEPGSDSGGREVDGRARRLVEEGLRRAAEVRASDLVFLTNETVAQRYLIVNGRRYPLGEAIRVEEGLAAMRVAFYVKEEGSEQTSYQERASQGFAIRDSHRLHVPEGVVAVRAERGRSEPRGKHLYMRLFYYDAVDVQGLEELGFTEAECQVLARVRGTLRGAVMIGGETVSGKSTTVAVCLERQQEEFGGTLNVVTVENPVEYPIRGAVQTAVSTAAQGEDRGKAFARALMHFCRINPSSGMVSEIRNAEAARQVMRFVDTGHQVWTTIHAHSANGIVFRLLDFGVPPAQLCKPGNFALLMKQVLVPMLCDACRLPAKGRLPLWLERELWTSEGLFVRNPEGVLRLPARGRDRRHRVARLLEEHGGGRDDRPGRGIPGVRARARPDRSAALLARGAGRRPGRRTGIRAHRSGGGRPLRRGGEGHDAGETAQRAPGPQHGQERSGPGVIGRIPREERIVVWRLCAHLLESGIEIERVFPLVREMYVVQGKRRIAARVGSLEDAVKTVRLSDAVGRNASGGEALVFQAFGRTDAVAVFAAAARIAEVQDKLVMALRSNLAVPCFLLLALLGMVWVAGEFFVPQLTDYYPMSSWPGWSRNADELCLWVAGEILWLGIAAAAAVGALIVLSLAWTGTGRAAADRVVPFSWIRLVTGLAFLLTAIECVRAGLDLNERTFAALGRGGTRYVRHRIAAIAANMSRGLGFGQAMAATGHGFPEPQLIAVVAALEGMPQWESRLGTFCERWVERAEHLVRSRTLIVNRVLLLLVGAVVAGGISALFEILKSAGDIV